MQYRVSYFSMKNIHTKLRVQTVFLMMMNPWGSKHVEDVKTEIKALIWEVCISLVYVASLFHNARCAKHYVVCRDLFKCVIYYRFVGILLVESTEIVLCKLCLIYATDVFVQFIVNLAWLHVDVFTFGAILRITYIRLWRNLITVK